MKPLVKRANSELGGKIVLGSYDPFGDPAGTLAEMRARQIPWGRAAVGERLAVVRGFRHRLVESLEGEGWRLGAGEKRAGEVLASEVMPLADACRFLEREGRRLLAPKRLGWRGRPLWMWGTKAEVHREAHGVVLVIAPSNYAVFLPGVQVLQALVAGNAVLLKPGVGGSAAALWLARLLGAAGLPEGLLRVLPESPEAAQAAIRLGVDKVLFTGSAATGTQVLGELAERAIPATMELSGCDPVFVRADADLDLAVKALVFGLSLNEGRTCIGPRRVYVARGVATEFEGRLAEALAGVEAIELPAEKNFLLLPHVIQALSAGAHVLSGEVMVSGKIRLPLVLCGVPETSRLLREDFFAPVMSVLTYADEQEALELAAKCPYALGASVFSRNEPSARALARRICGGVVVINDVIVPTADPRVPFGGRKLSGFGVTRGAEGLLELTVPKVITVSGGPARPHLEGAPDERLLRGYLRLVHGKGLVARLGGLLAMLGSRRVGK